MPRIVTAGQALPGSSELRAFLLLRPAGGAITLDPVRSGEPVLAVKGSVNVEQDGRAMVLADRHVAGHA